MKTETMKNKTATEPAITNCYTSEALALIKKIDAAKAEYDLAKQHDADAKAALEGAKSDVEAILTDGGSDVEELAQRLVLARARLDIIESRITRYSAQAPIALQALAEALNAGRQLLEAAANYTAKTVREAKRKEIAKEAGVNIAKIPVQEFAIQYHKVALSAERLAVRALQLDNPQEIHVLPNIAPVAERLATLSGFKFDDPNGASAAPAAPPVRVRTESPSSRKWAHFSHTARSRCFTTLVTICIALSTISNGLRMGSPEVASTRSRSWNQRRNYNAHRPRDPLLSDLPVQRHRSPGR